MKEKFFTNCNELNLEYAKNCNAHVIESYREKQKLIIEQILSSLGYKNPDNELQQIVKNTLLEMWLANDNKTRIFD